MGHDHHPADPHAQPTEEREIKPRTYSETTPSRRARPQFDPVAVANEYLDDMERGGRLHGLRQRAPR
ncbi:MAG: hypothetical protein H6698_06410 [Myxococcales bacterium]|nr:hypothetical protein [Myxococcales bacterium]MCB9533939.1 hypothetical protein [Myxococcales bacterium]